MSKKFGFFEITLFVGIAYFLLKEVGSSIYNNIKIGRLSYKFDKKDSQQFNLTIQMPLINTGSVSVPLERFEGVVLYGQNVVSRLNVTSPFTIKANDTISVPIKATIQYSDIALNIFDIFKSKNIVQPLKLKGVIRATGFNIPINQNIPII